MSFSFRFVGKKDALKRALDRFATQLGEPSETNFSRREFDEARPHVESLLDQNVSNTDTPFEPSYEIAANGHASFKDGVRQYGSLSAEIKPASASIVV